MRVFLVHDKCSKFGPFEDCVHGVIFGLTEPFIVPRWVIKLLGFHIEPCDVPITIDLEGFSTAYKTAFGGYCEGLQKLWKELHKVSK